MELLKRIGNIALRIALLFLALTLVSTILFYVPFMTPLVTITGNLVMVLPVIIAYFILRDNKRYSLLVKDKIWIKNFFKGSVIGIVSIGVVFLINLLRGSIEISSVNNVLTDSHFYVFLIMMLGVGIGEEVFSRGYMQNMSIYFGNIPLGIVIPSGVFALLHFLNPGALNNPIPTVNLILISIVFALMTLFTNSIWMAIGYHFTWNFFQGKIFGMNVSGLVIPNPLFQLNLKNNDLFYGGQFGPEGGLLVTIVLLISLGLMYYGYKNRKYPYRPIN